MCLHVHIILQGSLMIFTYTISVIEYTEPKVLNIFILLQMCQDLSKIKEKKTKNIF